MLVALRGTSWHTRVTHANRARAAVRSCASSAAIMQLDKVGNFRDLSEACPRVLPGKVFRCAVPKNATQQDKDTLLSTLGIAEMIDLRAREESDEDSNALFFQSSIHYEHVRSKRAQQLVRKLVTCPDGSPTHVRHQVSLLDRSRFMRALLWHMPWKTSLQTAMFGLYDTNLARDAAINEINRGGLEMMYEIMFESSQREIGHVLQLVLDAAEAERPLLFYCAAGKDRTGMVAALLLSCCGASEEEIVADYIRSDAYHQVALLGLEKKKDLHGLDRTKFERAPEAAVRHALAYVAKRWGSLPAYMEHAGFPAWRQARLGELLCKPHMASAL